MSKIKVVKNLYFLNKLLAIVSFAGIFICIIGQSYFFKLAFAVNWWSVLLVFFIFFFFPVAIVLARVIKKYKNTDIETIEMHKDVKKMKKLFWSLYLIPYILIIFNINLFWPDFLERDAQGLGFAEDLVWQDSRFFHKDQIYFKENNWIRYNYLDERGIRQNSFGMIKRRAQSFVMVDVSGLELTFSQIEVLSKLSKHYPLFDF